MITCHSIEQMVRVVALLIERGMTFEADTETCVVTLTGGY
jgi:hypothetical protein